MLKEREERLKNNGRHPGWMATFGMLTVLVLLLAGCSGGSSYDTETATTTSSQTTMITAATLNKLVTDGYGTDAFGYNKMVILDVDSAAGYAAGHIPGAYHLDTGSDLRAERNNGVSFTASQVPTAAIMDNLIQRTGIDKKTVVVLVGNGNLMSVGRAYFNFRYWGFPKERLRVLNGTKSTTYQGEGGYELATATPELPTPSTYSVAELSADTSVRASLEEMISMAEGDDSAQLIIDARSAGEYDGSTIRGVSFGGHIRGAVHQEWSTLIDPDNPSALLPRTELQAAMEAAGAGPEVTSVSYCQTSWRAAATFLALDAVLGWPAKIYDGAWLEWGMMARNDLNYGGALAADSPWRTDRSDRSEDITYQNRIVEPLVGADSFAAAANLINEEDKAICGTAPAAPNDRTVEVLLAPADLKAWIDGGAPGLPADPWGYGKFTVLQVDSAGGYGGGHIPGAFLLDTGVDLSATRDNGIAATISQVATKAQMDALIQRTGIDADTIIVLAGSNMMHLGRAYFNFRYWGFPRERLRVLDGSPAQYAEAVGGALSGDTPAEAVSTYSVCELPQDSKDQFRATFQEMRSVAGDPAVVIADSRSAAEYAGDAGGTKVTSSIPSYVAFEGHVKGAKSQEWSTLLSDGKLLPRAELETLMNAIGADATTTVYTYCRTSWRAAVNFLALDAILQWPVKIYDGAWIQWGQMARNESQYDGSLNAASPWRVDLPQYTEALTYNKTDTVSYLGANSYAPSASLINQEDAAVSGNGASSNGASSSPPPPTLGY